MADAADRSVDEAIQKMQSVLDDLKADQKTDESEEDAPTEKQPKTLKAAAKATRGNFKPGSQKFTEEGTASRERKGEETFPASVKKHQ